MTSSIETNRLVREFAPQSLESSQLVEQVMTASVEYLEEMYRLAAAYNSEKNVNSQSEDLPN